MIGTPRHSSGLHSGEKISHGSQKRHPRTMPGFTSPGSRRSASPINTWSPCAAMIRNSVDLPAPGRPTTAAISPDRTKSDTPARAGDVTPAYRWVIWSRKTYITQLAGVETPLYRSRRADLVIVQSRTERC